LNKYKGIIRIEHNRGGLNVTFCDASLELGHRQLQITAHSGIVS
jgi:hypothetical protein